VHTCSLTVVETNAANQWCSNEKIFKVGVGNQGKEDYCTWGWCVWGEAAFSPMPSSASSSHGAQRGVVISANNCLIHSRTRELKTNQKKTRGHTFIKNIAI
jgi:hypothetical protein